MCNFKTKLIKEMKKPNCYSCKYRGKVPGSCHSSCHHPKVDNPVIELVKIISGDKENSALALNIRANPHGVKSGWFTWPIDFDPAWLLNCEGFEEKENEEK